jgi:hypothetical protein
MFYSFVKLETSFLFCSQFFLSLKLTNVCFLLWQKHFLGSALIFTF